MELAELKTTIKEKLFTGGFISGPDLRYLRALDSDQRKQAEDLLDRAEKLEASGMTANAERLRSQVNTMVNRAGADLPPSKREKLIQRKSTMRQIKHQK